MSSNARSRKGSTKVKMPSVERRAAPRYPILQKCLVRPAGGSGDGDWHCLAYNLSTVGIGITLPCPLQAGTVLVIEAWELPGTCPLQARIVRSVPFEFLWFCGCELLSPLGKNELQAWLAGSPGSLPADSPIDLV